MRFQLKALMVIFIFAAEPGCNGGNGKDDTGEDADADAVDVDASDDAVEAGEDAETDPGGDVEIDDGGGEDLPAEADAAEEMDTAGDPDAGEDAAMDGDGDMDAPDGVDANEEDLDAIEDADAEEIPFCPPPGYVWWNPEGPFEVPPIVNGIIEPDEIEYMPPGGFLDDNDSGCDEPVRNDDIASIMYGWSEEGDGVFYLAIVFMDTQYGAHGGQRRRAGRDGRRQLLDAVLLHTLRRERPVQVHLRHDRRFGLERNRGVSTDQPRLRHARPRQCARPFPGHLRGPAGPQRQPCP